jgi:hypothetical protein
MQNPIKAVRRLFAGKPAPANASAAPAKTPVEFKYANGRVAKMGDVVVNQNTGQRIVITSLHEKSVFHRHQQWYLHEEDHAKLSDQKR